MNSAQEMRTDSRIYVAGHRGLAGSAILRELQRRGYTDLITRSHTELDLTRQLEVEGFFRSERPEYVIDAAGRVGGIRENSRYPADFIRDNILMQTHIISCAHQSGTRKLCFLGSSCIYPKTASQPITEASLMTGPLEPTNSAYAVAKISGIEMCTAYRIQYGVNAISVMPTNLYGPGDNFDPDSSHVLPAMIRKMFDAKRANRPELTLWGTGTPKREFLHVDDMARAVVLLMEKYDSEEIVNVGSGHDIAIADLAEIVRNAVGYGGTVRWDATMPDGTPKKLLDISRITSLGWSPQIDLEEGIKTTVRWFEENERSIL